MAMQAVQSEKKGKAKPLSPIQLGHLRAARDMGGVTSIHAGIRKYSGIGAMLTDAVAANVLSYKPSIVPLEVPQAASAASPLVPDDQARLDAWLRQRTPVGYTSLILTHGTVQMNLGGGVSYVLEHRVDRLGYIDNLVPKSRQESWYYRCGAYYKMYARPYAYEGSDCGRGYLVTYVGSVTWVGQLPTDGDAWKQAKTRSRKRTSRSQGNRQAKNLVKTTQQEMEWSSHQTVDLRISPYEILQRAIKGNDYFKGKAVTYRSEADLDSAQSFIVDHERLAQTVGGILKSIDPVSEDDVLEAAAAEVARVIGEHDERNRTDEPLPFGVGPCDMEEEPVVAASPVSLPVKEPTPEPQKESTHEKDPADQEVTLFRTEDPVRGTVHSVLLADGRHLVKVTKATYTKIQMAIWPTQVDDSVDEPPQWEEEPRHTLVTKESNPKVAYAEEELAATLGVSYARPHPVVEVGLKEQIASAQNLLHALNQQQILAAAEVGKLVNSRLQYLIGSGIAVEHWDDDDLKMYAEFTGRRATKFGGKWKRHRRILRARQREAEWSRNHTVKREYELPKYHMRKQDFPTFQEYCEAWERYTHGLKVLQEIDGIRLMSRRELPMLTEYGVNAQARRTVRGKMERLERTFNKSDADRDWSVTKEWVYPLLTKKVSYGSQPPRSYRRRPAEKKVDVVVRGILFRRRIRNSSVFDLQEGLRHPWPQMRAAYRVAVELRKQRLGEEIRMRQAYPQHGYGAWERQWVQPVMEVERIPALPVSYEPPIVAKRDAEPLVKNSKGIFAKWLDRHFWKRSRVPSKYHEVDDDIYKSHENTEVLLLGYDPPSGDVIEVKPTSVKVEDVGVQQASPRTNEDGVDVSWIGRVDTPSNNEKIVGLVTDPDELRRLFRIERTVQEWADLALRRPLTEREVALIDSLIPLFSDDRTAAVLLQKVRSLSKQ